MTSYYFERALFVVGEPNSGKATSCEACFAMSAWVQAECTDREEAG